MDSKERRSAANAIWLCGRCGTLVDSDTSAHTVTQLRKWKREAIRRASDELISGRRTPATDVRRVAELETAQTALFATHAIERKTNEVLSHANGFARAARAQGVTKGLWQAFIIEPTSRLDAAITEYKDSFDRAEVLWGAPVMALVSVYELATEFVSNVQWLAAVIKDRVSRPSPFPKLSEHDWPSVFAGNEPATREFLRDLKKRVGDVRAWHEEVRAAH